MTSRGTPSERARELAEAARLISASEHDLEAVLDALAEQARRLLGGDEATIHFADPDGLLVVRRGTGLAAPGSQFAAPGSRYQPGALAREAMTSRRPIFVPDYQRDPRPNPTYRADLPAVASLLVVPLVAAGELLGLLVVNWAQPTTLAGEEIEMGGALGVHAAVAIRNARLAAQVRRQAGRVEQMDILTAALTLARSRAEAAATVLTHGPAVVGACTAAMALLSADGGLEIVRIDGRPCADEAQWRRPDGQASAPLAAAVRERSPLFLESPAEIAARFPTAEAPSRDPPIVALAALPLALAGRVIGALGLGFDRPQRFEPEDRRSMLALAQRSTMALERTRLTEALARVEERDRIALELHDEVVQQLAGTMMALTAAGRRVGSDPGAMAAIHRAGEVVGAATDSIRAYMGQLRAPATGGSLAGRLAALVAELRRTTAVEVSLRIAPGGDERLTAAAAAELLLVAREATSNAVRDGGARAVDLRLSVSGRWSVLEMRDDGRGVDRSSRRDERGLATLRRRVAALGGRLTVTSAPGQGARVRLALPRSDTA